MSPHTLINRVVQKYREQIYANAQLDDLLVSLELSPAQVKSAIYINVDRAILNANRLAAICELVKQIDPQRLDTEFLDTLLNFATID